MIGVSIFICVKTKVRQQMHVLEIYFFTSDLSDFFAESDNSYQILEEHLFHSLCYLQFNMTDLRS